MAQALDADRLADHLQRAGQRLAPLYTVSGDEPLLVTEAIDALRAAARAAGYTDRTTLVMDARSDWSAVAAATQSVSLFGDRKSVVKGKSVSVRVDLGGGRISKTKTQNTTKNQH